jgi:sorting nexin-8
VVGVRFCLVLVLNELALDPSIEQVADLAKRNALPEPTLNLAAIPAPSLIKPPVSPAPAYSSDDPWSSAIKGPPSGLNGARAAGEAGPVPSSIEGTGLPREWWKRQEKISISLAGQQGFILNRYMVYQITTEVYNYPSFVTVAH